MAQARQLLEHGFGPFYNENSRLLILGSFPSVRSRALGFYYGHPQNRFWAVLAAVYGESVPASLEERKALLLRRGVALYDVIERCSIVGSADSSIADVTPASLEPILAAAPIGSRIFTNGAKAAALYRRHLQPRLGIPATALPSTSPANAAWSLEALIAAWAPALQSAAGAADQTRQDVTG